MTSGDSLSQQAHEVAGEFLHLEGLISTKFSEHMLLS
jgi:hypothetical protein